MKKRTNSNMPAKGFTRVCVDLPDALVMYLRDIARARSKEIGCRVTRSDVIRNLISDHSQNP